MLIRKKFTGKKNAAITIEVALSIALAVVALFLALGLFSDNLKTMAVNSGIRNVFAAKTSDSVNDWGGPTVASQEIVQVVADQGLDWYLSQAQTTINNYKTTPPTTEAQFEELAKAAAIARIGDPTGDKLSTADENYCTSLGININTRTSRIYTPNGKSLSINLSSVSETQFLNSVRAVSTGVFT